MSSIKEKVKKENIKILSAGMAVSIAMSFMLAFYAPLNLFVSNLDDFLFDAATVMPVLLITFCVLFIISMLILFIAYLIKPKVYNIVLVIYFVAYLATYIQGNFFTKKLPVLDGTQINWSVYRVENIKTLITWLVIIIISVIAIKYCKMEKYYKVVRVVSIVISAMLAISVVLTFLINQADQKRTNETYVSQENLLEMSSDTNFIILLLDCVDARNMNNVLENNPEYKDVFKDFTCYTNVMSTYPYTAQSIPYILTGHGYLMEESYDDFCRYAYQNSPLFDELRKRGYSMDLYEVALPNIENVDWFDSVYSIKGEKLDKTKLALLELKTTNFTYLPYYFKRYCEYTDEDFKKLRNLDSNFEMFSENDADFYNFLQNSEITKKEQKAFKFIHLEGAHSPYKYNEDVVKIPDATYESGIEACVTITDYYLNMLKESGVYDNSVIIIMSDHGYDGGFGQGFDRQNPMFFVKGLGESHKLSYNDAPISYADLNDAYVKLLDGNLSDDIFPYKEGDVRERTYMLFGSSDSEHMYEYINPSHASDTDAMYPTGKTYVSSKANMLGTTIAKPVKFIIKGMYKIIGNVGVTIIIFSALVQLILFPFYVYMHKKYDETGKCNLIMTGILVMVQLVLLAMSTIAIREFIFSDLDINTYFISFDLCLVPSVLRGLAGFTMVFSIVSGVLVSYAVCKVHPIVRDQGIFIVIGTYIVFLLLSIYMGWLVTLGAAFYYVVGNIVKTIEMFIIKCFIAKKDNGQNGGSTEKNKNIETSNA